MISNPPQRILVTGAAGTIGSAVVRLFKERGVRITALTLEDPGDLPADRVVIGDAGDPKVIDQALEGLGADDAVVHLAALPAPTLGTPLQVFAGNTRATFAVLDSAARAGIRRAAIASSMSVYGLAWAPVPLHPPFLPVDEEMPVQITDPYALSKLADEQTARYVSARYGTNVVALRLPNVKDAGRLVRIAERYAADPSSGASEFWTYLDVRDAARSFWHALTSTPPGAHNVLVAAKNTLASEPTSVLLARYHPGVPTRRSFPGRTAPVDTSRARHLLGFTPKFPVPHPGDQCSRNEEDAWT